MAWHRLPPKQTKRRLKQLVARYYTAQKNVSFLLRAKSSATNRRFPPPLTIDEREEDPLYW